MIEGLGGEVSIAGLCRYGEKRTFARRFKTLSGLTIYNQF